MSIQRVIQNDEFKLSREGGAISYPILYQEFKVILNRPYYNNFQFEHKQQISESLKKTDGFNVILFFSGRAAMTCPPPPPIKTSI